jgi:hypothetical protein
MVRRSMLHSTVAFAVLLGSCTTDDGTVAAGSADTTVAVSVPVTAPVGVGSVAPIVQACPDAVASGPMPTVVGSSPITELEIDAAALSAYGAGQDDFAFVRYETSDGGSFPNRLLVGFSTNAEGLAAHRQAVDEMVEHPNAVSLCIAAGSQADATTVFEEISALADEWGLRPRGLGNFDGRVTLELAADETAFADEVIARHGDVVTITVAGKSYPVITAAPVSSYCESLPEPTGELASLVTLAQSDARTGSDFDGEVVFRNDGSAAVTLSTGIQLLVVIDAEDRPVGYFDGYTKLSAVWLMLEPGQSTAIEAVGGLASCDPGLYAVPPGDYRVTATTTDVASGLVVVAEPAPLRVLP